MNINIHIICGTGITHFRVLYESSVDVHLSR